MAFFQENEYLLILFIFSILFISSEAASPEKSISGREGHVLYPFRRSAAEGLTALSENSVNNSTFILASERTERRDPLNHFKDYKGGWNISNRHYWASVGFTAAPLFGIALVWRLVLIIVSAVMLLLALLGFVFSILGLQFLVYILVLIGWFLVAAMFIMSGVFLLLHNAVGDTCVAMDEWVRNPTEHTALDDILPCVNAATANQSLYSSREVTYKLADIVNNVINGVSNAPNPSIRFNQSGPLMPTLCNPFNQDLSNRSCNAGEVPLSNASQVWKNYECNATLFNGVEICQTVGRVTPTIYDQMNAAVSVGFALYHYAPFLFQLEDCTLVRETFSSIEHNNCPSLRKYTNWVFAGLTLVSAAVMLSTIFWVVYARERRHRRFNKQQIYYEGRDTAGKP